MSLIPYSKVQPAHEMQLPCCHEVYPGGKTAAISDPTQRRCMVMNAAASFIQIDTLAVRLVGKHQRSPDVRMGFCLVLFGSVFSLNSDGITLATQCAAVAWYLSHREPICHRPFPCSITCCFRLISQSYPKGSTVVGSRWNFLQ